MPYVGEITKREKNWIHFFMVIQGFLFIIPSLFGLGTEVTEKFGLVPGRSEQAVNVVMMHFLHANKLHLAGNIVIFGLLQYYLADISSRFLQVNFALFLLSGLLIWQYHDENVRIVGASGWVFALFTYLTFRAFFNIDFIVRVRELWKDRNWKSIGISLKNKAFILLYGSLLAYLWTGLFISGIQASGVSAKTSYQAHLAGAVAGPIVWFVEIICVLIAYKYMKKPIPPTTVCHQCHRPLESVKSD